MKLKGTHTEVKSVVVDVHPTEIYDAVIDLASKMYPQITKSSYIEEGGFWMIYEYTHPHNNDDVYRKGNLATEEELRVDAWVKELRNICYK